MTNTTRKALNSSHVLGRSIPAHDAHVMARLLRSVTVVFWPAGAYTAEWSYLQPEVSDADMAAEVSKGRAGAVRIYRGKRNVNTTRDEASARIECK
jgi:hypothetical protein